MMKKLRWQLLVVLLALAAIAVLLIGQQPTRLPGVLAPSEAPAQGGVYTEALIGSFNRLNPVLDYYNAADHDVDSLIYSGLMRFDGSGIPHGDLADSWGISVDGTIYNFLIREGAVWHDGEPVTSEDVVFTVELMRDENIPMPPDLRAFWQEVEVEAFDPQTVSFKLPEAFAPFMDYLTFAVLPEHLLGDLDPQALVDDPFNLQPVGSGPYRFERLLVENGEITGVVLNAFEDYYGGRPFIDQMVFRYYPDSAAALQAYKAGEVMGISRVSEDILDEALKEPGLDVHTARLPNLTLVFLNLDNSRLSFFQEPEVRRALLMAINRPRIRDQILNSQAIIADGPILPGTWAYYEEIEHVEFDPNAAVNMLREAGFTFPAEGGNVRSREGSSLSFELVYPDSGDFPAIAEAIRSDWASIGVQAELKPVSYESLLSDYLEPREYEAALVDINLARSPDPDPYPFWHQTQKGSGQNYSGWDDRQASEYLEQARVLDNLDERKKRYRNFQVRFTDQMPALPLFYPVYSYAIDQNVQGVRIGPLFDYSDRFATLTNWYLVSARSAQVPATPQP
ncbi:MAG: peptide ABC transporter substrate-binding protein [Chloroflexi bacterium]|nr:peptide ABC transporter substrate-binding protein [Chloroflexota bacterium]